MNSPFSLLGDAKPLVAIASDRVLRYGHGAHSLLFGYVDAVAHAAGALPLAIPAEPDAIDFESLIANVDGVVFPGSPSNVEPCLYGSEDKPDEATLDRHRDATTIPLIKRLVQEGVPVLGICRGLQEMNVAWGGTLDPAVSFRPGAIDHREGDHNRPIAEWYADSHLVEIDPNGLLAQIHDHPKSLVNSLHHQGIKTLGIGLKIEAVAPDGLIEAFSVKGAESFALAVQWHPEMRVRDDELSRRIFEAFGAACRLRRATRLS